MFWITALPFLAVPLAAITSSEVEKTDTVRALEFPKDGRIGRLLIGDGKNEMDARGVVFVPKDATVALVADSKAFSGLREVAPDALDTLFLQHSDFDDSDAAYISHLSGLTSLNLAGTDISDNGILKLTALSQLREIDLSNTKVTDQIADWLCAQQNLRILMLNRTKITEAGIRQLECITKIEVLMLPEVNRASCLTGLIDSNHNLSTLSITRLQDGDTLLQLLYNHPTIKMLLLSKSGISNEGFDCLSTIDRLKTLSIQDSTITIKGDVYGSLPKQLEMINLQGCTLSGSVLQGIGDLPNLKTLVLRETNVNDLDLKLLSFPDSLETIDLSSTRITDAGLMMLSGRDHLKELDVSDTQVSEDGVDAFLEDHNLEEFIIPGWVSASLIDRLTGNYPQTEILRF